MKSFVAARCARRQLEAEAGTSSRVAELEEMVSALQQEKKDLEASLASMHIRAETSIRQLDEARGKASAAEDAAKTAEEGWKKAEELARTFRQAVVNEATPPSERSAQPFGALRDRSPTAGWRRRELC